MAEITTQMVKELREATGAGILDCKKALGQTDGDFDKAVEELRKKGLAAAAKKANRDTNEGIIGHYIHAGSKVASLIQVHCETDFVARTEQFQQLARDLAMQVVAARPLYTNREDVPAELIESERNIYREQVTAEGKSANIADKIVEGKLEKWYADNVLLEQVFIKDSSVTIQELITKSVATLGENIQVGRFSRLEIGG